MTDQPPIAPYSLSDFLQWRGAKQLVLQPRFQRGRVWSEKAQSYLIDTIIRKLPIPPVVVRLKMDVANRRTVREVVDGQQRLQAVFRYFDGEIPILDVAGSQHGGKFFNELTPDEQASVLSYKLAVWTLENISDEEVLSIFARLNTFVVPLNKQELRNAMYFGEFKQSVYMLAGRHLEFWRNSKVFSDNQVARMINAQFVSMVLMTFERGIISTKASEIDKAYDEWDNVFPNRVRNEQRFSRCIAEISERMPDIAKSPLRREVFFFTLVAVVYDALYGLPNGKGPAPLGDSFNERLAALSEDIRRITKSAELSVEEAGFQRASSRATADAGSRRTRHNFFWKRLIEGL